MNPKIGNLPIQNVSGPILRAVLEQCAEKHGLKTAARVRQTALQVFEHGILTFKTKENPAKLLRGWKKIPPRVNRPHLLEHQVNDLIEAMDAYSGYLTTKLAAKFLLLTFVRKTEVPEARWVEKKRNFPAFSGAQTCTVNTHSSTRQGHDKKNQPGS